MPTLPVPIFGTTYKNVNGEELKDEASESYDCFITEKGGVVRRPGLLYHDTNSASSRSDSMGLYWWNNTSTLVWVHGASVALYQENPAGTYALSASVIPIGTPTSRPTFANNGTRVLIANGGNIYAITSTGGVSNVYTLDSDSPAACSHVAFLDGYILANSVGTNKFYWSVIDDYSDWSALNFASAAGNADEINALHVKEREIYLFGVNSVEIWENDGRTPFSRVPGGYLEVGTVSPYTVTITEDAICWLETSRRIVQFAGRGIQYVTTSFDKEIQNFSTVSDAFSMRMRMSGQDFIIFVFPSVGKAYCWNRTTDTWNRCGEYDSQLPGYNVPIWGAYTFAAPWGIHWASDKVEPYLYKVSDSYKDDNGTPIRLYRLTGHIDYGTSLNKRSTEIRLRMKRGQGLPNAVTPKLMLRWRDNNRYWSQEREIDLGDSGETDIVVRIDTRGIFRTRQYEFSATDAVDIDFIYAEEDIEVLSN